MREIEAQVNVFKYLSDPTKTHYSQNGKSLQILSPGRINRFEGPDFLDMAILVGGNILVGNSEFHFKSSDWIKHNHFADQNYNNLLLHIVLEEDLKNDLLTNNFVDTLIIDKSQVYKKFEKENINQENSNSISDSNSIEKDNSINDTSYLKIIEDLQHFALIRLLRKTAEIQKILNNNDILTSFKIVIKDFLDRYNGKKRRPVYTNEKIADIIENANKSASYNFLDRLSHAKDSINYVLTEDLMVIDELQSLLKIKIVNEGSNLRREIIVNCILPFAICLASEKNRIMIFQWYWSTAALNQYGLLKRKFPNIPQNFLWQQQGMLEYLREFGNKSNIISESIRDYGFAEILSFYKSGTNNFYNN